ncbi:hypothetical protein V8C35DRAFT_276411 [Trichoderma chlorosporum]
MEDTEPMKVINKASQVTIRKAFRARKINRHITNQGRKWATITSNKALSLAKGNIQLDKDNIQDILNIPKVNTCTHKANTLQVNTRRATMEGADVLAGRQAGSLGV